MNTITNREASIFACFVDTVVSPEPLLPPVNQTDAAAFFDRWLTLAPRANAAGLRAAIVAIEVAPLTLGYGKRMRKLDRQERARYLHQLEKHKAAPIRQATKALKGIAFLCYYGDDGLMKRLGYDPDANVARGRRLRVAEGRP
jgi:hypothetical protein